MAERERLRGNIIKKVAKFAAGPIAAGIAMVSVGCTQTMNLQFPDCKTDPQIKHIDTLIWIEHTMAAERRVSIDGIILKPVVPTYGPTREIDLLGQSNRLNIIKENEHYQLDDRENGRSYDIVIEPPGNKSIREITVEATCPPKK